MSQTLEESLFQRKQTAFLLSPDKSFARMLKTLWSPDVLEFTVFENGTRAIEHMFNEPPDLPGGGQPAHRHFRPGGGQPGQERERVPPVAGGHVRGPRGRGDPLELEPDRGGRLPGQAVQSLRGPGPYQPDPVPGHARPGRQPALQAAGQHLHHPAHSAAPRQPGRFSPWPIATWTISSPTTTSTGFHAATRF